MDDDLTGYYDDDLPLWLCSSAYGSDEEGDQEHLSDQEICEIETTLILLHQAEQIIENLLQADAQNQQADAQNENEQADENEQKIVQKVKKYTSGTKGPKIHLWYEMPMVRKVMVRKVGKYTGGTKGQKYMGGTK